MASSRFPFFHDPRAQIPQQERAGSRKNVVCRQTFPSVAAKCVRTFQRAVPSASETAFAVRQNPERTSGRNASVMPTPQTSAQEAPPAGYGLPLRQKCRRDHQCAAEHKRRQYTVREKVVQSVPRIPAKKLPRRWRRRTDTFCRVRTKERDRLDVFFISFPPPLSNRNIAQFPEIVLRVNAITCTLSAYSASGQLVRAERA